MSDKPQNPGALTVAVIEGNHPFDVIRFHTLFRSMRDIDFYTQSMENWSELVGIPDRSFDYHFGQELTVDVANGDHPITQGMTSWAMYDETYTMADAGPGSEVLLTTDHPKSMKTIGWTRTYRNARVFCLQLGHDPLAWENPQFRHVLERGIHWVAKRI